MEPVDRHGRPGIKILYAYTVKENLHALLALVGTRADRHLIRDRLWSFYVQAASCPAPEAHRLVATVDAWWLAIGPSSPVLQRPLRGL